jgi:hypothetical protein
MDTKTRARGASTVVALGSLAAALILFVAGPAGASIPDGPADGGPPHHPDSVWPHGDSTPSGGCVAAHGSVCSGDGVAIGHSTSSGSAVAVGGSTASGCSKAVHESTASGGSCAPETPPPSPPPPPPSHHGQPAGGQQAVVSGGAEQAAVATPTEVTSLAFTGSSTGPLMAIGAAALVLGLLLVALGSERTRAAHSS